MNSNKLLNITASVLLLIITLLVALQIIEIDYSIKTSKILEKEVIRLTEKAYFEGQKDAINKDIRIKLNQDSCWIWIKSPWDNGKEPIFNPYYSK